MPQHIGVPLAAARNPTPVEVLEQARRVADPTNEWVPVWDITSASSTREFVGQLADEIGRLRAALLEISREVSYDSGGWIMAEDALGIED